MAIEWLVMMEWAVVTLSIAIVVGVTHSFYQAAKRRGEMGAHLPRLEAPATGYFISVTLPEVDSSLLRCEELLNGGSLEECVKSAYAAAERLLEAAALNMGVASAHESLEELGGRLAAAGLAQLEAGELKVLDSTNRNLTGPLTSAVAARTLAAAFYLRQYLSHAPVQLPTKPIADAPH
jgi:hypothetical protein